MTLTLPPDIAAIIQAKVESGRYDDADEVMREALAALEAHEQEKMERFLAAIAIGDEQIARGETIEWDPNTMDEIWADALEDFRNGVKPDPDVCP
jgi:antitoxin ParD1/3/4